MFDRDAQRRWQAEHPRATRVLTGLLSGLVFFLLSLIWSPWRQALGSAVVFAILYTAMTYLLVDRRKPRSGD